MTDYRAAVDAAIAAVEARARSGIEQMQTAATELRTIVSAVTSGARPRGGPRRCAQRRGWRTILAWPTARRRDLSRHACAGGGECRGKLPCRPCVPPSRCWLPRRRKTDASSVSSREWPNRSTASAQAIATRGGGGRTTAVGHRCARRCGRRCAGLAAGANIGGAAARSQGDADCPDVGWRRFGTYG